MEKLLDSRNKVCLVGKIKGLSEESKRSNKKFNFYIKNYLGLNIRHHLLAYAILKGLDYKSLEKSCRKDNKPNSKLILEVINCHIIDYYKNKFWTIEKIDQWLSGEANG